MHHNNGDIMSKCYEYDNEDKLYKRLNVDFNLYGINLNNKEHEEIEDLLKYGKVK